MDALKHNLANATETTVETFVVAVKLLALDVALGVVDATIKRGPIVICRAAGEKSIHVIVQRLARVIDDAVTFFAEDFIEDFVHLAIEVFILGRTFQNEFMPLDFGHRNSWI